MPIDTNYSFKLYVTFRDSGPTSALIVPAVLLNLVSNTGVLLNLSVLYVTLKSRSLRGSAHFLLALISAYEIVHQLGHLLLLFVTLTGTNFIDIWTAMQILLPSLFAQNAVTMAITLAALDRLFAIVAPLRRKRIKAPIYLSLLTLVSVGYGVHITRDFYAFALLERNLPVTGLLSDLFNGIHAQQWFVSNSALNLLAIGFYLLIWIVIRQNQAVRQTTNGRLLKSLLAIVCVNICGYLVNMSLYRLIYSLLCADCYNGNVLAWQLSFVTGILMNVSGASNAPILFLTSTDYRDAYNRHLPTLFGCLRRFASPDSSLSPSSIATTNKVDVVKIVVYNNNSSSGQQQQS